MLSPIAFLSARGHSYLFLETQGLETMKELLYISRGDRQRQVLTSTARLAVLQLTDNDLLELL